MKQMEGMMVMMQTLIDADGNGSQDSAKRAADAQAEKDAANKLSQGEGKFLCKTPFRRWVKQVEKQFRFARQV